MTPSRLPYPTCLPFPTLPLKICSLQIWLPRFVMTTILSCDTLLGFPGWFTTLLGQIRLSDWNWVYFNFLTFNSPVSSVGVSTEVNVNIQWNVFCQLIFVHTVRFSYTWYNKSKDNKHIDWSSHTRPSSKEEFIATEIHKKTKNSRPIEH
jgi:hypothetical protein